MEGIISWFSKNHVAANFLMVIVLFLGFSNWFKLKKEIFPETSIDSVIVSVPFPNASPEEVERGVVVPIEEAIADVDGIDRMTSVSSQSVGSVTVEVESDYDVREVMDDLKTRIDAVQNIAEEAEEPILEELVLRNQVMSIAVSADTDERTLREVTEQVKDGLLNYEMPSQFGGLLKIIAGGEPTRITYVTLGAIRDYEISIEVSEDTLRQYGLTFDQVSRAVRQSSLDLPGGSVKTSAGEVLIRTEQKRYDAEAFGKITVVTRDDGSVVHLRDIAVIDDGFNEDDIRASFDNRPAMLINVFRVGNQDTLKIAEAVKTYVREIAPRNVPEGVTLEIWKDDSVYLSGRMNLLAKNGIVGLLLVFVVLALFLRPSLALLVSIGIPVSFAGAIMTMSYTGISINMISLFAFILVLGIVVDDAIIVGENVYSRIRRGEHPRIASPKGTHEVGVVVIFGILTTAMAFTPMLGLSGVSGKIWPNIPLVVIPTLLFSLLQSKLVLPAHLALLRPHKADRKVGPLMKFQQFFSHGLENFVDRIYRPVLEFCLRFRYAVLAGFVAIFMVTMSFVATGWLKFKFFPEVEGDVISTKLTMPAGVPFETTRDAVKRLEDAATQIRLNYTDNKGNPLIKHMLATVGTQPFQAGFDGLGGVPTASNVGEVTIELQPAVNRDLTSNEIISIWRDLAGPIPGAVELTFTSEAAGGGNAIDLVLVGNDLEELEAAAEEVKEALAAYQGVIDIASSNRRGKRELKLDILPEGEAMGLRLEDVSRQVRQGFFGDEVQRLQRGRDEVRVYVRYPQEERESLSSLTDMKIRTIEGEEVPFTEVATAGYGRAAESIERADRRRAITITADVDTAQGANANEVVAQLIENTLDPLVNSTPGLDWEFQGEQKDQAQSISEMMRGFIFAMIGMYVLMAIPLKSYFQPLIVMSVIPFGLVGAVMGHMAMGFVLSIMSMCGVVALAGVVVNDSLVLVDYVNRHRKSGHSVLEAAREAGAARFRPILLTSMTTFAGLTPMLLETDIQALFLVPMAVSLAFGILFATTITLILVPSVYLIQEDIGRIISWVWRKLRGKNDTVTEEGSPVAG